MHGIWTCPGCAQRCRRSCPEPTRGLVTLEPDLVGERHVLKVISDELIDACLDWAGENRERRRHILTVLNRATRPEHGVEASRAEIQLGRLVTARAGVLGADLIAVALETPGRLLDLCSAIETQVDKLKESALTAIDATLPLRWLTLMSLSLRVAERLAAWAKDVHAAADASANVPSGVRDEILEHLAARIGTLSIRLSNLGRREEALGASQEAVAICRRLAETRPEAFLPDLATGLNNLGLHLSDLRRREEALGASQEAVAIRRRLAETRPDAFLPDLAGSLSNLGIHLSELGRREEALGASQEAIAIRRRLAETRPDAFLPDLAGSLNNISADLSNLGRHEEALGASQEAVAIRRRLAETRPDAFLPDLAMSLGALGQTLASTGRHQDALAARFEGLTSIAPFVERQPQAFGGLARALCRDYLESCERAGGEPNSALVERIARLVGAHAPPQ
jgi:tetratricopeptide (TPR) repeat protein